MAEINVRMRLRRVKIREKALTRDEDSPVVQAMNRAGETLVEYAKAELSQAGRVKTGNLYNSIDYRLSDSGLKVFVDVGSLAYNVDYAPFVEDGTPRGAPGRGRIYPKRAKYLRFVGAEGSFVFAKSVRGQAPTHYLRNAIERLRLSDL